jgi:hypothetical protein
MLIDISERERTVLELLRARGRWTDHLDGEIRKMRDEGVEIIGCIKLVVLLTGCTFAEAKRTVHRSAAWSDERLEREETESRISAEAEIAFGPLEVKHTQDPIPPEKSRNDRLPSPPADQTWAGGDGTTHQS